MTAPARTPEVRRRALAQVGVLAALLLVAGTLPWFGGGSLAVRLIGLPLLVAGLLIGGVVGLVAYRLRQASGLARPAPASVGSAGCGGCACGAGG
ncbi:MAG TPA: hypothetical protein VIS06_08115, partial [Mycobacteriales bacterium]